jgi:hypothetical protein
MKNCLRHTLFIGEKLVVPNANDLEALAPQVSVATAVARVLCMLASIKLDDQPSRSAEKINDEMIDRHLQAELESAKSVRPQNLP